MSEEDGTAEDEDMNVECVKEFLIDEAGVQHAITVTLKDVWSGLHLDDNMVEDEDGKEDGEDVMERKLKVKMRTMVGKCMPTGMAKKNGLFMLGEDFECNFISNGKFMCSDHIYAFYL